MDSAGCGQRHPVAGPIIDAQAQRLGDQCQYLIVVGELKGAGDPTISNLYGAAQYAGTVARQLRNKITEAHIARTDHPVTPAPDIKAAIPEVTGAA